MSGAYGIDDIDLEVASKVIENYVFCDDDYNSLCGETKWERSFRRGVWEVTTRARTLLTLSPTHFHIRADLDAFEGDSRVFSRSWDEEIPRDLV